MTARPHLPQAEPHYFGPVDRPKLGWLHRSAPGAPPRAEGLVVCNPFGSELLRAHRSLRHFAESAALLGVPAFRFDYDGTGDSAGTDRDAGRLAAWVQSVHDAIDELKRATGVTRVHLLGVRLGATLAALAAMRREDVAGLVAVVPVVSGKKWLREIQALQVATRVGTPPPSVAAEAGVRESAGFVLETETWDALANVDLLALERPPAAAILVITRADLAPDASFAERMGSLGAHVEHRALPGFAEMMFDPHETILPAAMIDAVSGWLDARVPRRAPDGSPSRSNAPARTRVHVAPGIEEAAVLLDSRRALFGIVSAPAGRAPATRAVVMLNSGANHRIGPGRLYVELARRWAARGYLVLRVDQSGIGDSSPQPGQGENVVYARSATRDVEAAVAFLREHWGATSFSAMGICSGAYDSLKAAVAGVALDRVVALNPLVFFWKEGMSLNVPPYQMVESAAQYRKSMFEGKKWVKLLAGKVNVAAIARVALHWTSSKVAGWVRDAARRLGRPMADDLGAELEGLAHRGVAVAFVFSAGDPGEELLRVQAGSSLRRLVRDERVHIHRIVGPNHTFTPVWSHALLAKELDEALGVE